MDSDGIGYQLILRQMMELPLDEAMDNTTRIEKILQKVMIFIRQ